MKKYLSIKQNLFLLTLLAILVLSVQVTQAQTVPCGPKKVLVCHKGQTLCISENALKAHLGHGDTQGACTTPPDTTTTCSVTATGGTITCTNSTVTLTATSPNAGATFTWAGPGGFTSTGPSVPVTAAGTFTVTATTPTGCTATDTAVVRLNVTAPACPLPNDTIAVPDLATAAAPATIALTPAAGTTVTATISSSTTGFSVLGATNTAIRLTTPAAGATATLTVVATNPANGCTTTCSAVIVSDSTVVGARSASLKTEQIENVILKYPNPLEAGYNTITFQPQANANITVTLYNESGQRIATLFSGEVKANTTYPLEINKTDLRNGLHFLKISSNGKTSQTRIIINK